MMDTSIGKITFKDNNIDQVAIKLYYFINLLNRNKSYLNSMMSKFFIHSLIDPSLLAKLPLWKTPFRS